MNKANFQQNGGFPIETNTFDFMQSAYDIFNCFGEMAGDKTIISGCESNGTEISDGYIYYNKELLFFKGGVEIDNIVIVEEVSKEDFEDGIQREVYKNRYATFGFAGGGTSIDWSEFKRFNPLSAITEKIASLERKTSVFTLGGGMVFWNKPASEIPEGWREVVDWRSRIPVGYNPNEFEFNSLGKTGGAKTHRLTEQELPPHKHGMEDGAGGDDGSGRVVAGNDNGTQSLWKAYTKITGGGQSFSIMNPYRVVMFIECIDNN